MDKSAIKTDSIYYSRQIKNVNSVAIRLQKLSISDILLLKVRNLLLLIKGVDNMDNKKGKHLFGVCNVNEKGQIVIPKQAREIFNIKPGDSLVLFGDEKKGLALVKVEVFSDIADNIINSKD